MKQNPYDSPAAVGPAPKGRKSLRPYFIASMIVIVIFISLVAIFLWRTEANIHGSEIWFNIPGESASTSPSGDRIISYDRMLYTTVADTAVFCVIVLGLSILFVNGLVFFFRR